MKIIKETGSKIILKDSSWSGFVVGIVLVMTSFYFTYSANIFSSEFNISSLLIPGILFFIGILLFFTSSTTTTTIDKQRNIIEFIRKTILGTKNKTYPIDQVSRLEMREQIVMQNSSRSQGVNIGTPQVQFQLEMILKDGTEIPLEHLQSPAIASISGVAIMSGSGRDKVLGQKIATFIGVPYQEISPMGTVNAPPTQPSSLPPFV